jgi:hypothetical protein
MIRQNHLTSPSRTHFKKFVKERIKFTYEYFETNPVSNSCHYNKQVIATFSAYFGDVCVQEEVGIFSHS